MDYNAVAANSGDYVLLKSVGSGCNERQTVCELLVHAEMYTKNDDGFESPLGSTTTKITLRVVANGKGGFALSDRNILVESVEEDLKGLPPKAKADSKPIPKTYMDALEPAPVDSKQIPKDYMDAIEPAPVDSKSAF